MNEIVIEGNNGKKFVIDLSDSLQRRYELVRELKLIVSPKEDICTKYGYSRVMDHLYETAWDKNRWDGFKEKKNGPKSRSKRTEKLEKRVLAIRFKSPEKDMYEITDLLTEEGYNICARSVARVLSEHGVTKKNETESLNPILLEKSDSNSPGTKRSNSNRTLDDIKRELDKVLKDGFNTFQMM